MKNRNPDVIFGLALSPYKDIMENGNFKKYSLKSYITITLFMPIINNIYKM